MTTKRTNPPLDTATFLRIRKWYILALSGIAMLIVSSQFLIQRHLNSQLSDSRVINVAGRQRAYSQKLVKEALIMTETGESGNRKEAIIAFRSTLDAWELSQQALIAGNDSMGLPKENDPRILSLFDSIAPYHTDMLEAARTMLARIDTPERAESPSFFAQVDVLLAHERPFLRIMDRIVNEYDRRSREHLQELKIKEYILLAVALLILLLEMLFIFRPLSIHIRNIISKLIHSQSQSEKDATSIRDLYQEKERSLQALQELNFVLDQAALFASIKKDGTVVFISKKFLQFLGFGERDLRKPFSELLTNDEGQQQYLSAMLRGSSTGIRSEEIRIRTAKGEDRWLDMSIIPMPQSRMQQSILLMCSDITERKLTQMQVEQLTREKYEEHMRLKQVQASQIVEGQEEERKRIAKDIHDGIGQMLTALKFNIESINPKNREKTAEKIQYLKDLAADLIKGVRTATFNLTPPELGDHGIVPALQKMTAELSKLTGQQILFENKSGVNFRLDSLAETNMYRVVQEAVNNAIKYARASYILVSIQRSESMVSIMVDDDGIGFETEEKKDSGPRDDDGGMGLFFMRERISYINGRLFIRSEKGKGTRVTINYPLSRTGVPDT